MRILRTECGLTNRYGVAQAVLMALRAGADTALWITTTQVPAVLDRLQAAVNTGKLTMDEVNQSRRRTENPLLEKAVKCTQPVYDTTNTRRTRMPATEEVPLQPVSAICRCPT